MGRINKADGELIIATGNQTDGDICGKNLGWKDANKVGDKGVDEVCRILKGKHEVKTHTARGKGPSGKGWMDTGCFIVEVAAKDTQGNIRPSGIFAPDLADEAAFWNILLDEDGKVAERFSCSVGTMRAFINDLRKDEANDWRFGWSGNDARAYNCKVSIDANPGAEAVKFIRKERNKAADTEFLKGMKKAYKRYSIDWCK